MILIVIPQNVWNKNKRKEKTLDGEIYFLDNITKVTKSWCTYNFVIELVVRWTNSQEFAYRLALVTLWPKYR